MTPPTRVLIVATSMSGGGAERVMSTIVGHLDRTRVRPSLALLRPDVTYPLPSDVAVHHLGYGGLPTFPGTARRLRKLVRSQAPDVVLSSVNATGLITGWALRGLQPRPRWIARVGSSPERHDRGLRRWAAHWLYPMADRFVANSHGLAAEMAACYPFTTRGTQVIANPTDFEAIDRLASDPSSVRRPPTGTVVVAVGRLSSEKRYDVMLRAFRRVREVSEAVLWICGEGPERRRLARLAASLGVAGDVRWFGFLDNPYAIMRQADVFVLTSEYEGLPNALIEAQGLGLPAVATRCPHGPDEIIEDGTTGLLTSVGDLDALSEALLALLSDPERRKRMGAAGSARARRLFDKSTVAAWERLLVQLGPAPTR